MIIVSFKCLYFFEDFKESRFFVCTIITSDAEYFTVSFHCNSIDLTSLEY